MYDNQRVIKIRRIRLHIIGSATRAEESNHPSPPPPRGSMAFRRSSLARRDPMPFSLYLNLESGVSWQLGGNSRELMHRVPMVTDDPSLVAAPGGPPA